MIFKTLVESLLQHLRDPDDTFALNALNTLIREIRFDLVHAFSISSPLIERYTTLFSESNSYFDFLIKVNKLPLDKEYFSPEWKGEERKKILELEERKQRDPLVEQFRLEKQKWRDGGETRISSLEKSLENVRQTLDDKIEAYRSLNDTYESTRKKLTKCQRENETIHHSLKECEMSRKALGDDIERERRENSHLRLSNDQLKRDLNNYINFNAKLEEVMSDLESHYKEQSNEQFKLLQEKYQRIVNRNSENLEKSTKDLKMIDNRLQDCERENAFLKEQLGLKNDELEQLKMELEKCLSQMNHYESSVKIDEVKEDEIEYKIQPSIAPSNQMEQDIITVLKNFYPTDDWKTTAQYRLKEDLRLSKVFEQQLSLLKVTRELISVNPESLAETVLNLLKEIPESDKHLKAILAATHLPLNESLVDEITRRVLTYTNLDAQLTGCEWEDALVQHIKAVKRMGSIYCNLETSGKGWLKSATTAIEAMVKSMASLEHIEMDVNVNWDASDWYEKVASWTRKFHEDVLRLKYITVKQYKEYSQVEESDKDWFSKCIAWFENTMNDVDDIYKRITSKYSNTLLTDPLWFQTNISLIEKVLLDVDHFYDTLVKNQNKEIEKTDENWFQKSVYWIDKKIHDLTISDAMLKDILKQAPDLEMEEGVMNICQWKTKFIERFNVLVDMAQSLLDPSKTLLNLNEEINSLKAHATAAGVGEQMDWFRKYIDHLQVSKPSFSKSPREKLYDKSENKYSKLITDCKNIAQKCKFEFNKNTFYKDWVDYEEYKIRMEPFWYDVKAYFMLPNKQVKSLRDYVEHTFQKLLARMNVSVYFENLATCTFETHASYYLNEVNAQWNSVYNQWLKDLNLKPDTAKQLFVQEIKNLQNEEWMKLYVQWLKHFKVKEDTPKEMFLDKLRKPEKRSSETTSYSVNLEKKLKLEENWSSYEIQDFFALLFKEFFKLKWDQLKDVLPTFSQEQQEKLEKKLMTLEKIKQNMREGTLINIYTEYIRYDIALTINKPHIFKEILSNENLLKESIEYTLAKLREMMNITER